MSKYGKLIMNDVIYSGLNPDEFTADIIKYDDSETKLSKCNVQEVLEYLDKKCKSLNTSVEVVKSYISVICQASGINISGVTSSLSDISNRLSNAESSIDSIRSSISNQDSDIDDLQQSLKRLSSSMSDISDSLSDINIKVNSIPEDVFSLGDTLSVLSNSVNGMSSDISDLDSRLLELDTTVSDIDTRLSDLFDDYKKYKASGGNISGSGKALLKVKVKDGLKVILSNSFEYDVIDGEVTIDVSYGEYTITAEDSKGNKSSEYNIIVDTLKVYELEIYFNDLNGWLRSADITVPYTSVNDIPELEMRKLMSNKDSVDILCKWYESDYSILDDLLNCDYFMKWLGIVDYAYERFSNCKEIWDKLYLSTKWRYMANTSVPIMTSDTAPYGKCFASSVNGTSGAYAAWRAFDGVRYTPGSIDRWVAGSIYTSGIYIGYSFPSPVNVRVVTYQSVETDNDWVVQYSDDESLWISTNSYVDRIGTDNSGKLRNIIINDCGYHRHWRIYLESGKEGSSSIGNIYTLNFLGRAYAVKVPNMTSDIEPYGKVITSSPNSSGYLPYYAFTSGKDFSGVVNSGNVYVGYEFPKEVCIKAFFAACKMSSGSCKFKLQYSDDCIIWEDTDGRIEDTYPHPKIVTLKNDYGSHRHWRIFKIGNGTGNTDGYCYVNDVQFYGYDFSDRLEKKYLYDNGLSLVDTLSSTSKGSITLNKDYLRMLLSKSNTGTGYIQDYLLFNVSDYKLMMLKLKNHNLSGTNHHVALALYNKAPYTTEASDREVFVNVNLSNPMYDTGLNISKFDGAYYLMTTLYSSSISGKDWFADISEWWLE